MNPGRRNNNNDYDGWGGALLGAATLLGGLYFLTKSSKKKYAIDCEMVGSGNKSILAWVVIVDENYKVIYNQIVRPVMPVTDYRTWIHGLDEDDLENGRSYWQVQKEVRDILSGNILIGHSLDIDLGVLGIQHENELRRDVATYGPFQKYNRGYKPSLKDLAWHVLGKRIQVDLHDPMEDAVTCMQLYKKVESQWG